MELTRKRCYPPYLRRGSSRFERIAAGVPSTPHISAVALGVDLHLPVEGLIDVQAEAKRLSAQLEKRRRELHQLSERLANPMFLERAKPEVVAADRAAAEQLRSEVRRLEERLEQLQ
ncbi:MAG: hypothetical protein C4340_00080 [Armatimonadota bacterium]